MTISARYIHTNIVAHDWRKLADFYINTLGLVPRLPERHMEGDWLYRATAVEDAHIDGIHLRLPGYGDDGPTLEIFQYNEKALDKGRAINRPGLAHIAFAVDDVEVAFEEVKAAGGDAIGELVTTEISGSGVLTFVYASDPEGNVIELQRWR